MAKLLISYPQRANPPAIAKPNQPPGQPNSEPCRVVLYEEVLEEIKQNFAGIPEVIPVLSLGNSQCGRASTLEAFLGEGSEDSFSSQEKPPGVYVWTTPVPLNSTNLLLVKMWGVDFASEQDGGLDLITKKVMIVLMSISSICLFCGEKTTMFKSLTAIYELYMPIKERLHLEVSKFLVFVEKEATLAQQRTICSREAFNERGFGNPPEILYRGRDGINEKCKEKLLQIVGTVENHRAFMDSHKRAMEAIQPPDFINALAIILTTILDISKKNFDFQNFIEKIPNFTNPKYREEMLLNEEMDEISRLVQSGTALEFFDEISRASKSYKICESVLNTLSTNYGTDKPIIVMPIIGNPGMGKSTLLNHIVKYLISCSEIPQLFKAGNTSGHTTRASQALSYPLRLGGNQLMLVDLEGLEGVEIEDQQLRTLQDNLISAILTIASVPCILIRNELSSMVFVEGIIKKLITQQNYFGYKIERVHLLFHDRDCNDDTNPTIQRNIQYMNEEYFKGKTVIKVLNKPNFKDVSNVENYKSFMREFTEASNFPKKDQYGSHVLIKKLLTEMRYISEHNTINMSEIRLADPEKQACDEYVHEKSSSLHEIFESVKGDETDRSLELAFDEASHQHLSECNEELRKLKKNWTRRALIELETEVISDRMKILAIQLFHETIRHMPHDKLWHIMEEQLENLYKKYWWVNSFNNATLALKKTLENDKERYPEDLHQMDQIIEKFKEKQTSLKIWYYGKYVIGAAGITASGVLGLDVEI